MRNRLMWVAFGLMLTLAMGSAAWACDGCGEEAVTPNTVADETSAVQSHDHDGATKGRRSSGKTWTVTYGYPVADESEPVDEPDDDDLEPWDEAYENPFDDDEDILGPMAAMMVNCTCTEHICGMWVEDCGHWVCHGWWVCVSKDVRWT